MLGSPKMKRPSITTEMVLIYLSALVLAAALGPFAKCAADAAVRHSAVARKALSFQPYAARFEPGVVAHGSYNFARVESYFFILCLVALLAVRTRSLGVWPALRDSLRLDLRAAGEAANGFVIGVVTVAVFLAAMCLARAWGVCRLKEDWSVSSPLLLAVVSALGAAVPEEVLFRGVLFAVLARHTTLTRAIILSSLFFLVPHFLSGHALLPTGFNPWTGPLSGYEAMRISARSVLQREGAPALTASLLLIGALLAWCCARTSRVYLGIGLHTGWVLAQKASYVVVCPSPDWPQW
nr:CPBP family intramembrane metalloprotease [Candidatus Brocadiia bacterium]